VEDGRARSLLFWERRQISLANGEAGNAAIVALGLKNRSRGASGWHDAQRLEHSSPEGGPMQVERQTLDARRMAPEQRRVRREILLAAQKGSAESACAYVRPDPGVIRAHVSSRARCSERFEQLGSVMSEQSVSGCSNRTSVPKTQ